MKINKFVGSVIGLMMAALPCSGAIIDEHMPPSITVQGTGKVFVKPNLAIINVGVVTEAGNAVAALSSNTEAMTALVQTVSQQGIAGKDVQTSTFHVQPRYDTNNGMVRPKIIGYEVTNSATIRVHNIDTLGQLLNAVVANGANRVDGVSMTVEDPSPLLDLARKEAIEDAHRKAAIYAQASGVQLGKVLYITEGGRNPSSPVMAPRMFAARANFQEVPIENGEQELATSVTVVFGIQ